jgi:hypothetical protein
MTRVFPLPAPARMSTGPSVVSTASRCCGLSLFRKDNAEVAPGEIFNFTGNCLLPKSRIYRMKGVHLRFNLCHQKLLTAKNAKVSRRPQRKANSAVADFLSSSAVGLNRLSVIFSREGPVSHPRPHQMAQPTSNHQTVRAVFEIPFVEFLALQQFHAAKSQVPQFVLQFCGIEE